MSNFRVGQKVVCIGGKRIGGHGTEAIPEFGSVYTVREFGADGGIRLVEIVNPPLAYIEGFFECTFAVESFRPVVERKTDISVFTALLTPSKSKVTA